jgi:4-hydroxythreonine-4-phosphate dehydrogenase
MPMTPRIGVTLGDPSGVGPEIIAQAVGSADDVLIFGDRGVLDRAGGVDAPVVEVTHLAADEARPGAPSPAGAAAQVAYLEAAVAAARRGEIDAICTAPISKLQAHAAGFSFPGHTEYLAARLDAAEHAMLFCGPRLRVILATIHIPLAEVPRRLRAEDIARAVFLGGQALARDLGVARPRIGVVALNPHAGESGLFGREEETTIAPGMQAGAARLAAAGIEAEVGGPLVPDAAFRAGLPGGRWDLLVAMYHDQGLIPVKLCDFEDSVNVTLGLPIVRTSPDHGVAYDVAGTGKARATSMKAALALARTMASHRKKHQ